MMQNITADKNEILRTLQTNRKNHSDIYDEAMEGYKTQAIRQLQEYLEKIESGDVDEINFRLPKPKNYLSDYDTVIKMLELEISAIISLSEEDVQHYVLDDWYWKRDFLLSNSSYSKTAARGL